MPSFAVTFPPKIASSGAVSMGDYDFVKVVLERLAGERAASTYTWMQIAIKPAKPLAFGVYA